MRNCNKIGIWLTVLPVFAIMLLMSSGCSEDVMKKLKEPIFKASSGKPAKATSPGTKQAEKPAKSSGGSCLVDIDNSLSNECDVLIDGSRMATAKPFTVTEIGLKRGKHKFLFMHGQEEIDNISADILEEKTTVLNPRAAATYSLFTISYTTGSPFSGREPASETIASQRVVQADFGLLQSVPETIVIKTSKTYIPTPYNSKTDSRTKLCKSVNPFPSTAEAIGMLTASSCVYTVYGNSGMGQALKPAIKQLGDANKEPAVMEALMTIAETCRDSTETANLKAVFEALKKYLPEIPEQRLISWVTTPCTNNYDTASTRVELAAQFLFSMKKEASITNAFASLPEINRTRILRAVTTSGTPLARRQLASLAIQNSSQAVELEAWNLFARQDFEVDDEIMNSFANKAANMPVVNETDKNRKKQLSRILTGKIRQNSKTLDQKWLAEKLAEFALDDDYGIKSDALAVLVEQGKLPELVKILPQLDSDSRKRTLRSAIESCGRNGQALTPVALDLFKLGLTDKESATRMDSFRAVTSAYSSTKNGDILALLQDTSRKETDNPTKVSMDDYLKAYSPPAAAPAPPGTKGSTSPAKKNTPATTAAVTPTDPSGWPTLKVSGIVNSNGGKVAALINGQIVSENESVAGVKITAITRTGVEASFNGEKRFIPVRGGR